MTCFRRRCPTGQARVGDPDVALRACKLRTQRIVFAWPGRAWTARRVCAWRDRAAAPASVRRFQLRLHLRHLAARRRELRLCECALRLRVGRFEAGEDFAGFDPLAFLDQHLGHLAGDLGRDRGLATRGDVAVASSTEAAEPRRRRFDRLRRCVAHRDRHVRVTSTPPARRPAPAGSRRPTASAAAAKPPAATAIDAHSLSNWLESFIAFRGQQGGRKCAPAGWPARCRLSLLR